MAEPKPIREAESAQTSPSNQTLTAADLVIITGMSGSGKLTALKAFEDLGFYAVDNLPIALVPKFADLTHDAKNPRRAALIIDIREGQQLKQFPRIFADLRKQLDTRILFLDADDETLRRRFSETRRPHPLGPESTVLSSLKDERTLLKPIQKLADLYIDTSKLNVHELRAVINSKFQSSQQNNSIVVYVNSFGFRHGVPSDSDLVFDVRFLPNPNYIPQFKKAGFTVKEQHRDIGRP